MVTAAIPVAALLSKSAQAVESSNDNCVLAFDTLTAALNSTTLSNGDILFIHNMGTLSSSAIGGNGGTYFKVIPYPSSESLDIRRSIAMPSFSIQLISNDVIKVSDLAISAEGFERAREMLITGHDEFTGGVVEIPVGRNFINSEINIPIDGVNDFINTTYKGASKEASALDFSNAGILDNGIAFEGGPFYALRDMAIFRAPQSGVLQTKSPTVWNHVCLADMRITANKQHGINAERGFLGTYARVFSSGNSIHGFNMQGLHTSLSFDNCYAASNSAVGYKLNEITYSSMHSCAADSNGWHAYEISKSHTLAINGCGSENNGKSGFSLQSSLVLGKNKNISLNSVFAFTNNTANEGSANLLHMKSLDGGKNTATLTNSHSRTPQILLKILLSTEKVHTL